MFHCLFRENVYLCLSFRFILFSLYGLLERQDPLVDKFLTTLLLLQLCLFVSYYIEIIFNQSIKFYNMTRTFFLFIIFTLFFKIPITAWITWQNFNINTRHQCTVVIFILDFLLKINVKRNANVGENGNKAGKIEIRTNKKKTTTKKQKKNNKKKKQQKNKNKTPKQNKTITKAKKNKKRKPANLQRSKEKQ